jgi:hypothetical protein
MTVSSLRRKAPDLGTQTVSGACRRLNATRQLDAPPGRRKARHTGNRV